MPDNSLAGADCTHALIVDLVLPPLRIVQIVIIVAAECIRLPRTVTKGTNSAISKCNYGDRIKRMVIDSIDTEGGARGELQFGAVDHGD